MINHCSLGHITKNPKVDHKKVSHPTFTHLQYEYIIISVERRQELQLSNLQHDAGTEEATESMV